MSSCAGINPRRLVGSRSTSDSVGRTHTSPCTRARMHELSVHFQCVEFCTATSPPRAQCNCNCKVRASTLSRGVFFLLSGRIGWTRTRGRTSAYIRPRMTSEDERRQAKTGLEQRALRFVESAKRDRAAKRADMPRRELAGFAGLGEGVRQAGAPGGFDRLRRPPQSERRRLRRALHVDEVLRRSGRLAAARTCKLQSVSLETRK